MGDSAEHRCERRHRRRLPSAVKRKIKLGKMVAGRAVLLLPNLVIILILYGAGLKKGLFSDRGIIEDRTPALSLARVQMGFWFFLVIASFLFIWLVIGELSKIPASVLALIGIASGTTLGAAIIDNTKRASASAVIESENKKQIAAENLKASIEEKIKGRQQIETSLKGLSGQDPGSVALIEMKKQQAAHLSKTIEQLQVI
jgi:hypothetical protein